MNLRLQWNLSFMQARKWLAATLALMLIATSMTGIAYAAEDTVTGIEFDYDASDFNSSTNSLDLKVESDKINVTLFASVSGSTTKKNVTSSATWKSSSASIVKVESGVLTGLGKGTATITATYSGYTVSIKATSDYVYDEVTLRDSKGENDIPSTQEIKLGETLIYRLEGTKGNDDGVNISSEATWSSSNTAAATVVDGTITLVGTGSTTITAKYKGKSDSVVLTVSSPYKSIELNKSGLLELEIGTDDTKLTATVTDKDTLDTDPVTDKAKWTSSSTAIATVDKGSITPVSAGKATITVSYLGVTTSIEVVVRAAYQSIKLTPEKEYHMFLQDGDLPIMAEVLTNQNVSKPVTTEATWTSSNVIVATVNNGVVTPKGVGTTKITASHKGVSRSIEVTVYASINAVKTETKEIDGFISDSAELPKVTATIFDGTETDVSKLVKWTSSDEEIATIKDGKWTAVAIGETVLTGTVQGLKVEAKLTVHVKPLKLIASTKEMSVIIGKETALPSVTVVNEDGEEEDVTKSIKWKTTSDNIVLKAETVKGLEASTVSLTGTYLNKTITVKVRIEEEIVKFVVEPTSLALNPGRSKSIKVTGYYKDGKKISLGSKMNWEVNPDTIASVNGSSVKAIAVGSGKVSGSYQGKKVEIALVVTPKLKSLSVSSKTVSLSPGAAFAITLTANYTTGSPVNATASAIWTSSKPSVATVTDGKITAVSKGTSTIKASFGGKTITIRVSVK
ncbi:Ig-like domain-containing protein [Paenibacillus sp. YIM B09110]|uniref:Ig-like domain-containing protein n=1 Tax=Paenibacillus sp. YIM B09110 TaxID=3126102 RepID=UPI00301CD7EB